MDSVIKSETKLRAWGNSIGVVLSKEKLRKENLSVDDEVEVTVRRKESPLRAAFGKLKLFKARSGKSTDDLLKEIDEELDSTQ